MPCLSFFESDRAAVHRCRQPPNLCHSMGASDLIRRGPELWALQSAVESNATHDLVVHLIWRIDINILWGPHERSACWRQPPSSTITHKTSPLLSKSNKIYALQTHTFNKDKRPSTRVMQRRMAQNRQPGRLPDSVGWWVQDVFSAWDRASLATACSRYSLATQVRTVACCFQPILILAETSISLTGTLLLASGTVKRRVSSAHVYREHAHREIIPTCFHIYIYLRRGDTKGSCVTGDAGDHSVRKPTCDRALFCWHQALGLSIWTSCASKSPLWQNEGKISGQPKHGEAPMFLCFTRLLAKVKVTWQMDVEKSELQVEWWWWWGWGWWRWCWWWDTAKGLLREETHKACDESSLGGGMELDIQSRAEISGSEKRAPHDVHGCSSLSPFK